MARKSYDKQFKIAAVKLVLEDEAPVAQAARELSVHYNTILSTVGLANTKNTERVRFPAREPHSTLTSIKSKNYNKKTPN